MFIMNAGVECKSVLSLDENISFYIRIANFYFLGLWIFYEKICENKIALKNHTQNHLHDCTIFFSICLEEELIISYFDWIIDIIKLIEKVHCVVVIFE